MPAPAVQDEAMRAFIAALSTRGASAPSWCWGWSVHEVAAHVAASAQERADLIEDHLAGRPGRATRSWEERESPFRALPDAELRDRLVSEAVRFERAVAGLDEQDTIEYTGWTWTPDRLRFHSHSEAAVHRWDLLGDDDVGMRLLSNPALISHALAVFAGIPALLEAQRWVTAGFTSQPVRLATRDQPDVLVTPGRGLSLVPPGGAGVVIELHPAERALVLWGRYPARLREPHGNPETIDDLLRRLIAQQS